MTGQWSIFTVSLLVLTALLLFISTRRQLQLQSDNKNSISDLGLSSHLHTTSNEIVTTTGAQQQGRRQLWMHMGNYQDPSSIELRQPFGASDVHHINNNDMSDESRYDLPKVSPYNYDNVFVTAPAFNRELFLLYYNPQLDEFLVYINEHKDVSFLCVACVALYRFSAAMNDMIDMI